MHDHIINTEQQLVAEVLAKYDLPVGETTWHSHDKVGPDDYVHYFTRGDKKYALVMSDFPNDTFIHDEDLPPVHVIGTSSEWLHIEAGELAGYYSLYVDTPLNDLRQ